MRAGIHDGYTRADFEAALADHYTVIETRQLPGGTRWLYHAEATD